MGNDKCLYLQMTDPYWMIYCHPISENLKGPAIKSIEWKEEYEKDFGGVTIVTQETSFEEIVPEAVTTGSKIWGKWLR